jgi:hypothetical protein
MQSEWCQGIEEGERERKKKEKTVPMQSEWCQGIEEGEREQKKRKKEKNSTHAVRVVPGIAGD